MNQGCHGATVEMQGTSSISHCVETGFVVSGVEATSIRSILSWTIKSFATCAARLGFDWLSLTTKPWIGDFVLPNMDPGNAYQIIATMAYTRVKYLIEQTVASGLIYLNSHALDFKNPEIRPYLDQYLRGSNGYQAEERVKLLKLLWDCLASEFGGRHELYEINYGGSTEEIRRYCLFGAQASGNADKFKGFAEECMAEYDLDGWKVPDLTDPGELSYHMLRGAGR